MSTSSSSSSSSLTPSSLSTSSSSLPPQQQDIFAGDATCTEHHPKTHLPCGKKAYYQCGNEFLCGHHRHRYPSAHTLLKNPHKKTEKQKSLNGHEQSVEDARLANVTANRRGQVECTKMRMMQPDPYIPAYRSIFPNFQHGKKKHGMPTLSPKSLGPISKYKNLPIALSIESRHQGCKCFDIEYDFDHDCPKDVFYERRDQVFQMANPPRHKFGHTKKEHLDYLRKMKSALRKDKNLNIPHCSVMPTDDGNNEIKLTYLESRWYYCTEYAELCTKTSEFALLVQFLDQGYNLNICGYDGHPLLKSMQEYYDDPSSPFGHELVLCCLLTNQAPWENRKPLGTIIKQKKNR